MCLDVKNAYKDNGCVLKSQGCPWLSFKRHNGRL